MKLLTDKKRQEMKTGKKPVDKKKIRKTTVKPLTKAAVVESLITTVQDTVKQVAETNQKTVSLIDSMVDHLGREAPAPVLQIDAPIVQMPELPAVPVAQPVKHLKVIVSQRDNRGLIQELDIKRVE